MNTSTTHLADQWLLSWHLLPPTPSSTPSFQCEIRANHPSWGLWVYKLRPKPSHHHATTNASNLLRQIHSLILAGHLFPPSDPPSLHSSWAFVPNSPHP